MIFNFLQVAQSARLSDGGQDDFLGSVDIPIRDIPVQGLDRWYKLEGKLLEAKPNYHDTMVYII